MVSVLNSICISYDNITAQVATNIDFLCFFYTFWKLSHTTPSIHAIHYTAYQGRHSS